jgi:tetratricopeptide (TPR) repeat protein
MTDHFEQVRVAGALCYRRIAPASHPVAPPARPQQVAKRPARDLRGLVADGELAAASGDLRSAVRAFRQATYLDPNFAISYFLLGSALELAGDRRESRRAFAAAGLAMMREEGAEDLTGLGGYTRRDLARAIASKLTAEVA